MRLHRELFYLITAHPNCRYVGSNKSVEAMVESLGFQSHGLAITNVKIGRRIIALICVPHRLWDTPYPTSQVLALRAKARAAGHAAVVVPHAVILREPRFGNAKLLNCGYGVSFGADGSVYVTGSTGSAGAGGSDFLVAKYTAAGERGLTAELASLWALMARST